MPKATEPLSTTPTRRLLLRRMAAATPAVALAAVPALAAPADPHPAWAAEAARLRGLYASVDDEGADRLGEVVCDLECLIVRTPAATPAGAREQLAVADRLLGEPDEEPVSLDAQAVRNALATLDELLAGRA